jgi:hypothetical protein
MRRARIFLAIVAYYVFVKRFINQSFGSVFYHSPEPNEAAIDTYKLKLHGYKFDRLDHFFVHNDSCNLGLHTGFLAQFLII